MIDPLADVIGLLKPQAVFSKVISGAGAWAVRYSAFGEPRHGDPAYPWTVRELAQRSALSRSAFFERFSRGVGVAPMAYLLAWRMALAKNLLRQKKFALSDIAERIGYGSASSFSTAFSRYVGVAPGSYPSAAGQ